MIKLNNLIKAVALITVFSIITRILGFVFRIYLSWEMGAEMLGIYQVALSIVGVLMMLVCSGLPLALSKYTAIYETQNDKKSINQATTATLIISLSLSIILCLMIFIFDTPLEKIFTDSRTVIIILTLLPSIIFSSIHSSFHGALWGQKRYFIVGLTELIEQVLRIIFFVLLAIFLQKNVNSGIIAGVSLSIACLFSAIIVMIFYFAKGNKLGNPNSQFRKIIKTSTPITGVRVATGTMQPLIAILLPMLLVMYGMTQENALSEFGIAVGMTMPLLFVPSTIVGSLAMVLLPELSSQYAEKNKCGIVSQINLAFTFSIFISMMMVPLYMGMWEDIGLFVYNNKHAGLYLLYSAWLMIPLALSNISSTILNALGMEAKSFKNYIIGAFSLLIIILTTTKFVGILSLIFGVGACMIISSAMNIRLLNKKLNIKTNIKKIIFQMTLLAIPTLLFTIFAFNIFNCFCPKFFALAFGSILGTICYVVLCSIFKVIDLKNLISEFGIKQKTTALQ